VHIVYRSIKLCITGTTELQITGVHYSWGAHYIRSCTVIISKVELFVFLADFVGDRRSGINQAVVDEVQSVFRGKTLQQLELLEKTIRNKLHGGEGVDVGMAMLLFHRLYLADLMCFVIFVEISGARLLGSLI